MLHDSRNPHSPQPSLDPSDIFRENIDNVYRSNINLDNFKLDNVKMTDSRMVPENRNKRNSK
mgnify:CR=1 FL=1